jgi:hypothetical protein
LTFVIIVTIQDEGFIHRNVSNSDFTDDRSYGSAYFFIACAAAYVGLHPCVYDIIVRLWAMVQKRVGIHDEARRAVTALHGEKVRKSFLQGCALQSLYGDDFVAGRFHRQAQAGFHGPAVHDDGAGTAIPVFTAGLASGETQVVPQHIQ